MHRYNAVQKLGTSKMLVEQSSKQTPQTEEIDSRQGFKSSWEEHNLKNWNVHLLSHFANFTNPSIVQ